MATSSSNSDVAFFSKSIAALLFLDYGMKSLMTTLRVHGAKGEGDSLSFFEKTSRMQLLTAEYVCLELDTSNMHARIQNPDRRRFSDNE